MILSLTDNEARVLKLILSVDLDALGLEKGNQQTVYSMLRKIRRLEKRNESQT